MDQQGGRVVGPNNINNAAPLQTSSHLNGISRANEKAQAQSNGDKFVKALEASFARDCGGKVKIIVQSDLSHPLGILGHRVTVNVVHD